MRKVYAAVFCLMMIPAMSPAWAAPAEVPIGAVIDWWRPDASWPVPDGYQICNGSTVTDSKSPLFNVTLPDLTGKFIMGVADAHRIGESGGSTSHSHQTDIDHEHGLLSTSSVANHAHVADLPSLTVTGNLYGGSHQHRWLKYVRGTTDALFVSWKDGGDFIGVIRWGNGIGNEGSGFHPFAVGASWASTDFFTDISGAHSHTYSIAHDHPPTQTAGAGGHNHSVQVPRIGPFMKVSTAADNVPPYYGLLKIMRIR